MRSNAFSSSSVVAGLTRYENAPCDRPCWRSSSTDSICTGMWRVAGSSLRLFSTVQPSMSGRNTSSVMAVGRYSRASDSACLAAGGDDALEALVARQAEQDARVVRIVLHDQQHVVAVAGCRRDRRATVSSPLATGSTGIAVATPARCARSSRRRRAGARRAGVGQRQVERERAALPGVLTRRISPPSSVASSRLIARPRPVPPYLRLGAGVGLLERLEDQLLLLGRDADAGVADGERDDRRRDAAAPDDRGDQPSVTCATVIDTWPCAVNLNAFESRFFRICCRRFGSLVNVRGSVRVELDLEREALRLGDVVEGAVDGVAQRREGDLLGLDRDRAGLDLRQVEDVVDQGRAGRCRPSGCCAANSTCFGVQVAAAVLGRAAGRGSGSS